MNTSTSIRATGNMTKAFHTIPEQLKQAVQAIADKNQKRWNNATK